MRIDIRIQIKPNNINRLELKVNVGIFAEQPAKFNIM
jgi:hypothetical protein